MNKSDLKNFAINARLALLQRVADRAALYGIDEEKCQSRAIVPSSAFHMLDGSVLSAQEVGQRNALIARISKIGYRQTMEEAAYTWFNRLIAIRYMQQHSLLPVSMRVLPEAPGALPQILREAQDVSLPGVEPDQVLAMLDANRTDALYRYLLIALCNALGGWLPGMFQQITSVAELLFPAALLKADSVLGEMARLDDDCWNEIQVIGWLYQYYNTQLKDETFELLKKNIKITKERIGAATQLFTPEWIVRYMVENSLGRLWLEGHPNETLRMKWRYYMDEAPQEPAVAARLAQLRAPYAALQPDQLTVLERMVPLVEHNYNLCELGPRGTGKSHLYKEISPYSILISGGKTSAANLFYSLSLQRVGLVGHWDCIAFDEVAGMHFRDTDAIQIMKDYMASGSFARGRDLINADASMVFVGNINDTVQNLLKITHLFSPFPPEFNNDSAFFDRMHYYLPGWEIPKLRSELLTEKYGLITDCLAEYTRGMRRLDCTHLLDQYFHLNGKFNKRDEIAVRKTMSGLIKLLFPDQNITRDEMEALLKYAIEGRRRVKEQLKTMAGTEFADTELGYCDENGHEYIVGVPEQSDETLISSQKLPSGHVFAVGASIADDEMAVYRLENKAVRGSGKFETQGAGGSNKVRESMNAAWIYFQNNAKKILPGARLISNDYLLYYNDLQEQSPSAGVSLAEWVGLCSALLDKPVMAATAIVGEIKLSGSMGEVRHLESVIRVAKNAGARRILLPMQCMADVVKIPSELLATVQPLFYMDAIDAAKKALDIY